MEQREQPLVKIVVETTDGNTKELITNTSKRYVLATIKRAMEKDKVIVIDTKKGRYPESAQYMVSVDKVVSIVVFEL